MKDDGEKLEVYMAHRSALLDYATPIVGDRMRAEDVVQEAWLRFSTRSERDRGDGTRILQPVAYLFRIVRNLALDLSRALIREAPHPAGDLAMEDLAADMAGPEREVVGRDQLRVVAAALAELPARTRRAFDLHRFDDKTFAEIGMILGISQGRAHALVQEAVAHCAAALLGARDR
jgi:RNA polymerase sigma factor (sigma-70 family)